MSVQDPGERDLGRRDAFAGAELVEEVDELGPQATRPIPSSSPTENFVSSGSRIQSE